MFTLFMALSGGMLYEDLAEPLFEATDIVDFLLPVWSDVARFGVLTGVMASVLGFITASAATIQRKESSLKYWAAKFTDQLLQEIV